MRTRKGLVIFAAGAAVAVAVGLGTVKPVSGQGQGLPKTSDGKPDFTGIWQAMNTANWDIQARQLLDRGFKIQLSS